MSQRCRYRRCRSAGRPLRQQASIHRSQGSQYDTVSVVLPATASSLLTRQLLYTAITRARVHVRVLATEESVRAGIAREVLRASGLRRVLTGRDA